MSAFAEIGYREDGPEEVEVVPGSVREPAHAAHVARPIASVAHIRATAAGDAAIERIKGILRERGRNGRGQSTTPARSVTPDAYRSAVRRVVRGGA
jgi:hypothetical protein